MKFSVAPESTSARVSVLLATELTYTRTVIDLLFDMYTCSGLWALIQTVRIRPSENPILLRSVPSYWTAPPFLQVPILLWQRVCRPNCRTVLFLRSVGPLPWCRLRRRPHSRYRVVAFSWGSC